LRYSRGSSETNDGCSRQVGQHRCGGRPRLLDTACLASLYSHYVPGIGYVQAGREMINQRERAGDSRRYSVVEPALHSIHECCNAEEFRVQFAASTGLSVREITHQFIAPTAPKAVFLVGSLPLGMATPGSDVDLIVLIDNRTALAEPHPGGVKNTDQRLAFSNENDLMRSGEFLTVVNGVTVDVTVAITSGVKDVYRRLRSKGPQLSENEVMTLSRLSTGWLLWESEAYLECHALRLDDPVLDVHCSTTNFVSALGFRHKGLNALNQADILLSLHLGRSSIELAYLAYFASEGLSYLGAKWLAQLGRARGATERLARHPLLREGIRLLFPAYVSDPTEAACYLQAVSGFLTSMRGLIEQKTLFRIAYNTCPLIHPI
jgi:hypothetical protein